MSIRDKIKTGLSSSFAGPAALAGDEKLLRLPVEKIVEHEHNVRRTYDDETIEDLAASIKEQGIIQPIVVVPVSGGMYRITDGHRRFRAAKLAGLERVKAITSDSAEEADVVLAQLATNFHAEHLAPLDAAHGLVRMMELLNLKEGERGTVSTLAAKVGKRREWVSRHLSLLKAAPAVLALAEEKPAIGIQRLLGMNQLDDDSLIETIENLRNGDSDDVETVESGGDQGQGGDDENTSSALATEDREQADDGTAKDEAPAKKSTKAEQGSDAAPAKKKAGDKGKKSAESNAEKAPLDRGGTNIPPEVMDGFNAMTKATGVSGKIVKKGAQYVVTLPMTPEQLAAFAKRFQ